MTKTLMKVMLLFFFTIAMIAQDKEMDPDAKKFYNEGNNLLKAGNFQGALGKYSEALKTSKNYRVYYQMGVTYKKLYKLNEAEAAFKECVKQNPDFAEGYNGLGGVYFSSNQFLQAIENYEKFEKMSNNKSHKNMAKDNIAKAYTSLGHESKTNGNYEKAAEYFRKAVEVSKFDKAYISLAEVYIDLAKYDEAIQAADNALNNLDKMPKAAALYYKGLAFKFKGQNEKAKENFKAGLNDKAYGQLCKYELDTM